MSELKALTRMMLRDRVVYGCLLLLGASIAAATTTFAVADAVLWKDLPYRDAANVAVVIAVCVFAAALPARRAARISSVEAMRN